MTTRENDWETWDDDDFELLAGELPEPLDPEDEEQAEPQPGDFWAPDDPQDAE